MLSRDALHSALPLTEMADSRKLMIVPVSATPLDVLVIATRSDSNFSSTNAAGEVAMDLATIEYIANKKDEVTGGSPHDFAMDDILATAVSAVKDHLLFARTTVAPAVADLMEKVSTTLKAQTPSALLRMEVVIWNPALPLQNNKLVNDFRRFEETPFDNPPLRVALPPQTAAELRDLIKTGSSSVDGDVEEWLAAKGDAFLSRIWENVFQIPGPGATELGPDDFRGWIDNRDDGVDNALAIFLLASKLVDNPLPGTETSLSQFNNAVVEYRNQAGARLCRAADELDNIEKNQVLVRSVEGPKTTVNGNVYRAWIEAGGDNEVLFGNSLNLPAHTHVDTINAAATELKHSWIKYAALTATAESNKRFMRTKEALEKHFLEQIREVSDPSNANLAERDVSYRLFREELAKVAESEFADLWPLCLKLVCRARFFKTDAERILGGIDRIKKENPAVDVREAAAVAMIDYVAVWVASQLKVVPL